MSMGRTAVREAPPEQSTAPPGGRDDGTEPSVKRALVPLLRTHLRRYSRDIWMIVGLQLLSTLAMLYLPSLNADIIDNGVVTGDTDHIIRVGGLMLVITLGQIACQIAAVFYSARTAMAVGRDLRGAIFDRVQGFSAQEVGRFGAPSLITRTTNDVQQVQLLAFLVFIILVAAPVMGIGGIIMAVTEDLPLSGLVVVLLPLLVAAIGVIVAKMGPMFQQMQERIDEVNRVMREQITGIRVIRAFVRDEHEQQRFATANRSLMDVSMDVGRLMSWMFPIVVLVLNASTVAVVWFGGHRVASGGMEIGSMTAFISYLMQILMSVMMATFVLTQAPRAQVSADRIREVLDTETSLTLNTAPVTSLPRRGEVELRDVEFRYPGAEEPVLHDVRITASPGETTAIIGSTGSGKTTLLNLIPRLIDATSGTVLVGGADVRDLAQDTLSNAVGLVPQRPYLFSGTVATNLRYGNPDATDDELWRALEVAQAAGFVREMPEGLDAPIGQGGGNVSGGQRQRLAIARMLVAKPDVYLFDDSFSALDYATDAALRAALAREVAEATVIIVAQRVATIRNADRIVVLDQGRVVGEGTHAQLMDGNETYREIVLSQHSETEAA